MKISNDSVLTWNQNVQKNQTTESGFDDWLKTPTKQNSGDEFYWQHQSQLQQSCLKFENHSEHVQHEETSLKTSEIDNVIATLYSAPNNVDAPMQSTMDHSKPSALHLPRLQSTEFMRTIAALEQNCSQTLAPEPNSYSGRSAPDKSTSEQPNSVDYTTHNTGQFKNYHLYIQNDQVELSLHAEDLNKEEQLELKQMIKLNLKNKGLSLKQLLINGVQHD
ncbi:hypothetical protein Lmor_0745 [Legionella moravica]|uniref:Uncharacterized protein n=1 Tax=Legionella moravica TaxID=39962 RepID=A0A378JZ78_9GAMM|nr:hypothetical protein [Legionella moravica]KTD35298.1 hypothetical protein Lmor_0745 [Legionella moravica]STX62329.1 Uncharacterised protein [Legionella moravica]